MPTTIRAECKIEEVSIVAMEGAASYTVQVRTKVLSVEEEAVPDVVIAGSVALTGAARMGSPYISDDDGQTWTNAGNWTAGMTNTLDLMEATSGYLFAGVGSDLGGTQGEIWRSVNRGDSWTRVFQHASDRYVWSLVQAANSDLIAGTANTGEFWRSQDNGDTWAKVDQTAANRDIKAMVRASNDDLIAGVGRFSAQAEIYRSQDNGANWALVQLLVPTTGGYVESLLVLDNGDILAGLSYNRAEIWRSQDNGATWAEISTLAGETYCYALVQDDEGTVYAGSGQNCKVSFSNDGGVTWTAVDLSNLDTRVYSLAVLSNGDILAGTNIVADNAAQVWRSQNKGVTWSYLSGLEYEFVDGVRSLLVLS